MNAQHCPLCRITVLLYFFVVTSGVLSMSTRDVLAADQFKDPYQGGIKLSPGGGEPGRAYMALIEAMYRKDYARICQLTADGPEVAECLQQKQALDAYIAMLTQPKSHRVLGGFLKKNDATLNVVYTYADAPDSTGFVVMKKEKTKWLISSFGGSGSGTASAEASGSADLGTGQKTVTAAGGQSEFERTGPMTGRWTFNGKDNKGMVWTGSLTIREQEERGPDGTRYYWCIVEAATREMPYTIRGSCDWNPARHQIGFAIGETLSYTANLSADRRSMTQGRWTEGEKDWGTSPPKVKITRTGVWSASYSGQ